MRVPARYLLGGAGLYVGVTAAVYLRVRNRQCSDPCEDTQKQDGQAFNTLADTYDQQIGWDEKLMGILLLRRWLVRQAKVVMLTWPDDGHLAQFDCGPSVCGCSTTHQTPQGHPLKGKIIRHCLPVWYPCAG